MLVFELESIGVALCEKYSMSKGKSISTYINEASASGLIKKCIHANEIN